MIDLKEIQKRIYANKVRKGFNVEDVFMEFCLLYEEVAEANRAYYKKLPDVGEELADVVIYTLGLAEILGINLEEELLKKLDKNEQRKFKITNGMHERIDKE